MNAIIAKNFIITNGIENPLLLEVSELNGSILARPIKGLVDNLLINSGHCELNALYMTIES